MIYTLCHSLSEQKMDGNPNDFETDLKEPDGAIIGQIFETLQILEIGENPLSNWNEISDVWGYCPNLERLKVNWSQLPDIRYKDGQFVNMKRLWVRNNKFTDISVFDELAKYPNLHQLNFVRNTFEDTLGCSFLRDMAIAKMPEFRYLHILCVLSPI